MKLSDPSKLIGFTVRALNVTFEFLNRCESTWRIMKNLVSSLHYCRDVFLIALYSNLNLELIDDNGDNIGHHRHHY